MILKIFIPPISLFVHIILINGGLIITLIFLNQNWLVQKEVISALRRVPWLRTVAVDITSNPTADQAVFATDIMLQQQCALLFTINEWGLDSDGVIREFLEKNRIVHINWCVDDPFFEEIIHRKKFGKSGDETRFYLRP